MHLAVKVFIGPLVHKLIPLIADDYLSNCIILAILESFEVCVWYQYQVIRRCGIIMAKEHCVFALSMLEYWVNLQHGV
jgi:hypothetical protein